MKLSKYPRPIPNRKITHEQANSEVITSYMDPQEMIAKYGPYKVPERKRYAR